MPAEGGLVAPAAILVRCLRNVDGGADRAVRDLFYGHRFDLHVLWGKPVFNDFPVEGALLLPVLVYGIEADVYRSAIVEVQPAVADGSVGVVRVVPSGGRSAYTSATGRHFDVFLLVGQHQVVFVSADEDDVHLVVDTGLHLADEVLVAEVVDVLIAAAYALDEAEYTTYYG